MNTPDISRARVGAARGPLSPAGPGSGAEPSSEGRHGLGAFNVPKPRAMSRSNTFRISAA